MPIPALSQFGVLPGGVHDCTLAEIQGRYADNPHRQALWARFEHFLAWVATQPAPATCLIDGGFTSDKAAPKDIDIVFDLSGCSDADRNHWFFVFGNMRDRLMIDYSIDFWVYYPGAGNDLRAFFEYVKPEEALVRGMQPTDRKGLLRVTI